MTFNTSSDERTLVEHRGQGADTHCEPCPAQSHTDRPNMSDLCVSHWPRSRCFPPTVEAISADICVCINIPKLTSCFPQTENAIAMCVCPTVSHATFTFAVASNV